MILHKVQQRVINGDISINGNYVPSMKGATERIATLWMKNHFQLKCKVMPPTDQLHLSDLSIVYDAYKSDLMTSSEKYITYNQFTRVWTTQFSNVIIRRKVHMGYYSICANLKSMAKGAKTTIKKCYKNIVKLRR